ncbi:MAG: glycosyl hydrolase family 18 protein [Patescibacteria group bacterium]
MWFAVILVVAAILLLTYGSKKAIAPKQETVLKTDEKTKVANPLYISYVINTGEASFNSLKAHLGLFNLVIADWLHLDGKDGLLREDNQEKQKAVLEYIRASNKQAKVFAMLNNYARGWQVENTKAMLANVTAREKLIAPVLEYIKKNNLDGISLDFEQVPQSSQKDYVSFLTELVKQTHAINKAVSVHVPADDASWDYSGIAKAVDHVIVMIYDEHFSITEAGPIASLSWTEDVLKKRSKEIPANKLIIGMGNYAYDWQGAKGSSITYQSAKTLADKYGKRLLTDDVFQNNYFEYTDSLGKNHIVWVLDEYSVAMQKRAAAKYAPLGYALYRLGSEDPQVWQTFVSPGRTD